MNYQVYFYGDEITSEVKSFTLKRIDPAFRQWAPVLAAAAKGLIDERIYQDRATVVMQGGLHVIDGIKIVADGETIWESAEPKEAMR